MLTVEHLGMSTAAKIIALLAIILLLNIAFLVAVLYQMSDHHQPEKRGGYCLLQFLIGSFFVAQAGTSFIERKWYGMLRNFDADDSRFYGSWVAKNCVLTVCGLGFFLWALDTARLIRLGL